MQSAYRIIKQGLIIMVVLLLTLTAERPIPKASAESSNLKSFHLYATDGYLTLPDGKKVYVWGYSLINEQGTAEYPAPTLEVNEGDQVEVTLTNIGAKKEGIKRLAHTIHWHGLDTDQVNDGVPHTSPAIQVGESFTYKFTAKQAGTYFYHCHVDTIEHLQMGMFGAFIVKAKDGVNQAWTDGPSYDKEAVFVLNEIDPIWHQAVEEGAPYDRTSFHPTYWTINGKAYPDTENDPSTMIRGMVGQTVLLRIANAGYEPHSMHMHGFHFQIIASDGRPLSNPVTKDTVLVGPGERYDLLVTFDQAGMYPLHSHNIIDNTNNGVYPGGLHTMMEVAEATKPTSQRIIVLKAGNKTATVDGSQVSLVAAPVVIKGITYVPLRFIGEQLGAKVTWKNQGKSITYRTATESMELWVGANQAKVNGNLVSIGAVPLQIGDTVMVPLRFVSEQLGGAITLNEVTSEVTLTAALSLSKATTTTTTTDVTNHEGHEMGGDSSSVSQGNTAEEGDPLSVRIKNSAFTPQKLTVKKGQTVTWVNEDTQIHTVIDLGDAFASSNLIQNAKYAYTFNEMGTYTYYCSTHPSMEAEVTVAD